MIRLLRDPAPNASGGGTVTPPPAPTPTPTPPPPPPPPVVAPPTLHLTVDEYQRLKGAERLLADVQAEKQRKAEEDEQRRLKILAEKGEAEKALEQQRTNYDTKLAEESRKFNELRTQYHGEKKANAIGDALSGVKFVSEDAARQARMILDQQFEAVADASGAVVVRDRVTGRAASEVIKEQIGSAAFAHFLDPASRGGAGASGGHKTPPSDPATNPILLQLRESVARAKGGAPGLAGTYN